MAGRPYRALRIMLRIFSLFAALVGLVFIFSGKPLMMRLFLNPPESEVSTLLLVTMKEMGGFALMFSAILVFASRDPERNVAIIDAVTIGLCVLVITPLLSLTRWMCDRSILATSSGGGRSCGWRSLRCSSICGREGELRGKRDRGELSERVAPYFVITPQAIRAPALPAGSVMLSSGLA